MPEESNTLYKLIVLYMLNKVEFPLTNAQIFSFLLEKEYTTFFILQATLADLEEGEMVRVETIRNSSYYSITASGKETITFFYKRIPEAIRKDVDQFMAQNKLNMRDEVSVLADYYKNVSGDYTVHAVVKEKYSNPIELSITVPTETHAKSACKNWRENSQKIYEFVMTTLL